MRRRKYFQGHTILNNHGFGYYATGKQIFFGRLIVFCILLLLLVPILNILIYLAFIALLPVFIHRSIRFNAAVTSYQNVRFAFVGTVSQSYKAFMLGPILIYITLGICLPIATKWQQEYFGNNMTYGGRKFKTNIDLGSIYKIWFLSVFLTFAGAVVGILVIVMDISSQNFSSYHGYGSLIDITFVFIYVVIISAWLIYAISVRNLAWSSTIFDDKHQLRSTLKRGTYIWIMLSNAVVSIITLGLMRPWAAVRMARYTWENSAIKFTEDVGVLVADIEATTAPVAAEYLDIEGFDFGF